MGANGDLGHVVRDFAQSDSGYIRPIQEILHDRKYEVIAGFLLTDAEFRLP